jgi:heat shock protein HtpX
MMVVSFLPALFMYIGQALMMSGMFSSNQRRNSGSNALIGIVFVGFAWVLNLFTLYLSRLREYFADRHSASVVDNGADKLSTGLAKIVNASTRFNRPQSNTKSLNGFKALFITNPETASADKAVLDNWNSQKMVDDIIAKKITFADKMIEALSTHPNIVKRLRALRELSVHPYQ